MALFDDEWRAEHAQKGDDAMRQSDKLVQRANDMIRTTSAGIASPGVVAVAGECWTLAAALATVAQAHYAAANVRARVPKTSLGELRCTCDRKLVTESHRASCALWAGTKPS